MKKIEVQGLGVFIELYERAGKLTEIEILVQAEKAIKREIMRREQNSGNR